MAAATVLLKDDSMGIAEATGTGSSPPPTNSFPLGSINGPSSSTTMYMPIVSPPTPAPSPSPRPTFYSTTYSNFNTRNTSPTLYDTGNPHHSEFSSLSGSPASRKQYLVSILHDCSPAELRFISQTITPMLKRDFLTELPAELALHILAFVNHPRTLARASQVCKRWHDLVSDDWLWKALCDMYSFRADAEDTRGTKVLEDDQPWDELEKYASHPMDPAFQWLTARERLKLQERGSVSHWGPYSSPSSSDGMPQPRTQFSHQQYFRRAYGTSTDHLYLLVSRH
jgi:F-box and WD-40 domain protein CDC4